MFGNVRILATVPVDVRIRCLAVQLLLPGAAASHHSAADLWGGVVPDTTLTHLTVPTRARRRPRKGLAFHHARECGTTTYKDVLVTTPEQTFCDLAGWVGLVDLVILGDSLVRAQVTTPAQLVEAANAATGAHRARARQAADLVRERVDSPMETRLRLMMVFAGLPEPVVNLQVGDDTRTFRLDLSWPE